MFGAGAAPRFKDLARALFALFRQGADDILSVENGVGWRARYEWVLTHFFHYRGQKTPNEGRAGMKNDFLIAITQLAAERNLPKELVLGAIETALVSAFRKEPGVGNQNIAVRIAPNTGEVKVFARKTITVLVQDPANEILLEEARKINPQAHEGDVIDLDLQIKDTGRIAAQTAKQVVMQRLRAAQSDLVYEEFSAKQGDMLSGVVQKVEGRQVTLELGRAEAVLPASEQPPTERYRQGQRLKVLIVDVQRSGKGPQVIVSRSNKDLLRRLFELEVPEIMNGAVVIRSVAREPGVRSKVAVEARQEGVDPVGACVGLRGIRIQNVVNELQGEKIDVVQWSRDPAVFLSNALSPAQVQSARVYPDGNGVEVIVPDRQLSLAIGREGQNARLAAKLTAFRIDIKSVSEAAAEAAVREAAEAKKREQEGPVATTAQAPVPEAKTAAVQPPVQGPAKAADRQDVVQQPVPAARDADKELEELLRLMAEEEKAQQQAAVGPEEEEADEDEEAPVFDLQAWIRSQQPGGGERPTLRFAEDILPERGRGGKSRGKKKEKKKSGTAADDAVKGRRPRGPGGPRVEAEDPD